MESTRHSAAMILTATRISHITIMHTVVVSTSTTAAAAAAAVAVAVAAMAVRGGTSHHQALTTLGPDRSRHPSRRLNRRPTLHPAIRLFSVLRLVSARLVGRVRRIWIKRLALALVLVLALHSTQMRLSTWPAKAHG